MKKVLPSLFLFFLIYNVNAQNTFPSTGNVGIGTNAPSLGLLQITGTGYDLLTLSAGNAIAQFNAYDNTDFRIIQRSNAPMTFWTNTVERMRITPGGGIGIGTAAPLANFHIFGGGQTFLLGDINNTTMPALQFFGGHETGFAYIQTGGAAAANLRISRMSTANSNLNTFEIYSDNTVFSGKLGIGTTSPTSTFQVDDGCSKASIGDAGGTGLNFGTSYLGFNAARSGTNWTTSNDGSGGGSGNNGGGVIYSTIGGEIYFAPVLSTGGASGQSLSDADIKSRVNFRLTSTAAYAKQIYVQTTGWADYVFNKEYALMPLAQVKSYIDQNHHLPDMPAAADVEKNGQNLGEINKLLTKKVEELTLYLIEQSNQIKEANAKIDALTKKLEDIHK